MIDDNNIQPEHNPEVLGTISDEGSPTTAQYMDEHLERQRHGIISPMW